MKPQVGRSRSLFVQIPAAVVAGIVVGHVRSSLGTDLEPVGSIPAAAVALPVVVGAEVEVVGKVG